MKINGCSLKMPYKTKKLVKKTEKEFKKANNDVAAKTNAKGDVIILGYKDTKRDELSAVSIIKPDGSQKMMYYYYYPAEKPSEFSTKVVEVWDRVKDSLIFDKSTTMQYKKEKTPHLIYTVNTDANLDDGVEITRQYPYDKYLSIFRRPK